MTLRHPDRSTQQRIEMAQQVTAAALAGVAAALAVQLYRKQRRHAAHATDERIFLHVTFEIKKPNEPDFLRAFAPLLQASVRESGCIKYQMTKEKDAAPESSTYVLLEEWTTEASLAAHEQTAHFKEYVPRMAANAKIFVLKYKPCDVAALAAKL